MRYIIDKKGLKILKLKALSAQKELAKNIVIKDTPLEFKNFNFASVVLNEEQVQLLKDNDISVVEQTITGEVHAGDYEKTRSKYIKQPKKLTTGAGCKVAVMDLGFEVAYLSPFAAVNFADANPGVSGGSHGTFVASIIKSSIGIANGCQLHLLKVAFDESSMLAALDYCIDNNIDIINMSFQFGGTAFLAAIQDVIDNDCIVVASSGNATFDTTLDQPAGENRVIAVNAVAEDGTYPWKNHIPYGTNGISIACSGVLCEGLNTSGVPFNSNGTSYSSPFFVGVFANYHEVLRSKSASNQEVLQHIFDKAIKLNPTYSGYGRPTF